MGESPDPPFETKYKKLFDMAAEAKASQDEGFPVVEECDLPLIDLSRLRFGDDQERQACKKLISRASREWGFFQVMNHGISGSVLEAMREEQVKLLRKPFPEKADCKELDLGRGYQWGTPSATCLEQLSWSESFHVPLKDVLGSLVCNSLRSAMEGYAGAVSDLAQTLADILAEEIGHRTDFFKEICAPTCCYLRLNRYPPCRARPPILGITPHTDSAFLTVLHQDNIGGLQMVKNGEWIAVKPKPDALVINIGDLFQDLQAWSNDAYRSVQHRVVPNGRQERFSTAYFFCPPYDTVIDSGGVYRSFTFGEYKKQVQEDVKNHGYKIGLPRFLSDAAVPTAS